MKHLILALPFIWAMTTYAQVRVADVFVENKRSPVGIVTEPQFLVHR